MTVVLQEANGLFRRIVRLVGQPVLAQGLQNMLHLAAEFAELLDIALYRVASNAFHQESDGG
jgi:hypothetical protein